MEVFAASALLGGLGAVAHMGMRAIKRRRLSRSGSAGAGGSAAPEAAAATPAIDCAVGKDLDTAATAASLPAGPITPAVPAGAAQEKDKPPMQEQQEQAAAANQPGKASIKQGRSEPAFESDNESVDPSLPCHVCGKQEGYGKDSPPMLLCDGEGCGRGFHTTCLNTPPSSVPEGKWLCPQCAPAAAAAAAAAPNPSAGAAASPGTDSVRAEGSEQPLSAGVAAGYETAETQSRGGALAASPSEQGQQAEAPPAGGAPSSRKRKHVSGSGATGRAASAAAGAADSAGGGDGGASSPARSSQQGAGKGGAKKGGRKRGRQHELEMLKPFAWDKRLDENPLGPEMEAVQQQVEEGELEGEDEMEEEEEGWEDVGHGRTAQALTKQWSSDDEVEIVG